MDSTHMNFRILIAENVKTLIDIPDSSSYTLITTPAVDEKLRELANGEINPIQILVFMRAADFEPLGDFFTNLAHTPVCAQIVLLGTEADLSRLSTESMRSILHFSTSRVNGALFRFLAEKGIAACEDILKSTGEKNSYISSLLEMKHDQEDLIAIGRSLSIEKDPDKLLRAILLLSKKITGADAGSIFLVEELPDGTKQIRFKYSHTYSKNLPYEEFVMPLDTTSIAGYVAVTGNVLNIPDAYRLSDDDPVAFNSSFDRKHDYRSKSMLVVPMRNHIDEIIGVIQLINSKEVSRPGVAPTGNEAFEVLLRTPEDFENKVFPFAARYESLMEAIAGQAAIAIENNRMMKQIQTQFEEFVKASVTAIESRDVATSGHSFRVAEICKQMAYAINSEGDGYFKDVNFSEMAIKELEYAALLHDFGKVYIDLAIFQKSKKLFPKEFENLMIKLDYLYRFKEIQSLMVETDILRRRLEGEDCSKDLQRLAAEKEGCLARIAKIKEIIKDLNEPAVTGVDPDALMREVLDEIGKTECLDPEGRSIRVLTEAEKMNLEIRRGSLNPIERREIESHVLHTYNFVSKIPWPPEYRNIPEIALRHHEKLDGSGYPYGLKGSENIPIQARIMAIADIYDALAASDRPYKKAVPLEKSLEILREEGKHNKLDKELIEIFIKYKIYDKVDKDSFKEKVIG